ncbi:MAG: transposase, partial [Alphaproteobacteria bacterium]|nr:transposase [Alphaproteobacteria bacterium]
MNLLETFDSLLQQWRHVFAQDRSFDRARRLTFGLLACLRQHLTSMAICATGRQFVDWSADYRLCSRSPWNPRQLFDPVFDRFPVLLPSPAAPVIAALDDTLCKKTGKQIPGVAIARDPLSPPFHVNLRYGLRFVQVSLLVSPPEAPGAARALPVRFDFAPPAVKPKKNAAPEAHAAYKKEKKQRALPVAGLASMASVRQSLDDRPETAARPLIVSGDGSYTNKTVLQNLPPRTTFIGRIRRDAKLHLPLPERDGRQGRPRRYGPQAPTPEQILQDDSIPEGKVRCFAAGAMREIPVKVYGPVFWRRAGADRPLLLVVIKPLGYRLRKGSKLLYRQPAFLVCTDIGLDLQLLVQSYIQRWEIGVSRQGHIVQPVKDRPRLIDSGLVAWEAPWRENKTVEPSDNMLRKEDAQRTRLQCKVNAYVASLHEIPVAETVDNARKQKGLAETG